MVEEPDNLILPDSFLDSNDSGISHSRRKRDVNYVVPTQITERGGKKRKIVIMVGHKNFKAKVDTIQYCFETNSSKFLGL